MNTTYNGFYRGRVVGHGMCGSVKVWIPEVYPPDWEYEPKFLPLAEQAQPITAFGSNQNPLEGATTETKGSPSGVYSYPAIGSYVWCFFVGGNIEHPVYFAACINMTPEAEDQWEKVELTESSKGIVFHYHLPPEDRENGEELDDVTLEVFTRDSPRSVKLTVTADNKDTKKMANNHVKISREGIDIFSSEKITIRATQGVDIKGRNISLNADNKIKAESTKSVNVISELIEADSTKYGTGGHFLVTYWSRFMGKLKKMPMRFPL